MKRKVIPLGIALISLVLGLCCLIIIFNKSFNPDLLIVTSDKSNNLKYYEYDLLHNNKKLIYSTAESFFPTAILSKDKRSMYFTQKSSDNTTQLYKYDQKRKITSQLTSTKQKIENVDFINPDYKHNLLYLRVIQTGHRNFSIATYNTLSGKVDVFDNGNDQSYQYLCYDTNNNELIVEAYSENQKEKIMEKINGSHDVSVLPTYKLITMNASGNILSTINESNTFVNDLTFSPITSNIIALNETILSKPLRTVQNFALYNVTSGDKFQNIQIKCDTKITNIKQISFSKNGDGLFFIASSSANKVTNKLVYNLYFLDMKNLEAKKELINLNNQTIIYFSVI